MSAVAVIDVCWMVSYLLVKFVGSCCYRCVLVGNSYLLIKFVGSCCYRCVLVGKSYPLIKVVGSCCYSFVLVGKSYQLSSHKVGWQLLL